ncbi:MULTISPECIES: tetratricopeptide repeat protein [Agrobacterium]|uniref:Sel1 repeat family protein n=1 Tax=Agrobacterium tumefaciens TaxID=358 RepID=A0AAE6EI08_AGRTU|nr:MULTISPECIES: tetratricopeptide repeat protein [Agrobacterium]QCL76670.1 sel1 repeat family protein [Agrobacterium tumefaciens]QCL82190.1 sel1 repeat family protein [Agrobacterium tumefaciens]CUX65386.1 TPR repeat-containing protein [Agrobacterium sp. NCPPB 925]
MKLSVIFTLVTVLPAATMVAQAAGKSSVPVPKVRATITVSPQALPATRLPSLEAAKKLPVARQLEIATAALNETRRDLRNPDLGFSLLISAAPRSREAVRLLAKGIVNNDYSFGANTGKVMNLLAKEAMRGSSSCVIAWARMQLGIDVPKNDALAYKWYRWAALVGNLRGIEETSLALLEGRGVTRDVNEAIALLDKLQPARRGARYVETASLLMQGADPDATARAEKLLLSAIDLSPERSLSAATKLSDGRFSAAAREKAQAVIAAAPKGGPISEEGKIARALWNSNDPAEIRKGVDMFAEAARAGDEKAVPFLAKALNRSGVPATMHDRILQILEPYADRGDMEAIRAVSEAYFVGRGTSRSFEKAAAYRKLAATQGDSEAQYLLGLMYAQATGVVKDIGQAKYWLTQSADGGYLLARSALISLDGMAR